MSRFRDASYLKSVYNPTELGESVAEVAFVGRSNVGKSTVLNAVCGRKELAKTSQTSGRTRTINVFHLGRNKWLVDLPGYGFAAGPKDDMRKFKMMLEGYLLSRPTLRLVVMLVDGNVGATNLDAGMAIWLQRRDIPYMVVANKCDKISASKQNDSRRGVANRLGMDIEEVRWISAEKGTGVSALANEIADILELT